MRNLEFFIRQIPSFYGAIRCIVSKRREFLNIVNADGVSPSNLLPVFVVLSVSTEGEPLLTTPAATQTNLRRCTTYCTLFSSVSIFVYFLLLPANPFPGLHLWFLLTHSLYQIYFIQLKIQQEIRKPKTLYLPSVMFQMV